MCRTLAAKITFSLWYNTRHGKIGITLPSIPTFLPFYLNLLQSPDSIALISFLFHLLLLLLHTWGQTAYQSNLTPPSMTKCHLKRPTCQHGVRQRALQRQMKEKCTSVKGDEWSGRIWWSGRGWRPLGGNGLKVSDTMSHCHAHSPLSAKFILICTCWWLAVESENRHKKMKKSVIRLVRYLYPYLFVFIDNIKIVIFTLSLKILL